MLQEGLGTLPGGMQACIGGSACCTPMAVIAALFRRVYQFMGTRHSLSHCASSGTCAARRDHSWHAIQPVHSCICPAACGSKRRAAVV